MNMWLELTVCAGIILWAGTQLSKYSDVIAEKTGLGRTWIGVILLATVTSLPELFTGIGSVTLNDVPNIAIGSVMGSCMFNLLIVAIIDLAAGDAPVTARIHRGHVLAAGLSMVLIGMAALDIIAGRQFPALGWIGLLSPVYLGVYLLSMKLIFFHEKNRIAAFVSDIAEELQYEHIPMGKATAWTVFYSLMIIAASLYLPDVGERIAASTGLGNTFVGAILIALTTSLPEVVVSIAAARIGAFDMAVANVFGSNLLNIAVLTVADVSYLRAPLMTAAAHSNLIGGVAALTMTAIFVVGITFQAMKKPRRLLMHWDSLGIFVIYVVGTYLLYVNR